MIDSYSSIFLFEKIDTPFSVADLDAMWITSANESRKLILLSDGQGLFDILSGESSFERRLMLANC